MLKGQQSGPYLIQTSSRRTITLLRVSSTFVLTTLLHLIIMHRAIPSPYAPYSLFWDRGILSFFLLQPVGILIDFAISLLSPSSTSSEQSLVRQKKVDIMRRIFAWAWLLWSARYWADAWVRKAQWNREERLIPWSPVRGLLWNDWNATSTAYYRPL